MTELSDLVEAYKREVSVPGAFSEEFPTVTDEAIRAALGDAFGEAQIDGFFGKMVLDTDDWSVSPDLSTAGAALVVIYAGLRVLRQQIMRLSVGASYKAGPVEYESRQSAAALTEMLRQLERRKNQIIEQATRSTGTSVFMLDAYASRGATSNFYGGFFAHEMALPRWGDY